MKVTFPCSSTTSNEAELCSYLYTGVEQTLALQAINTDFFIIISCLSLALVMCRAFTQRVCGKV